MKNKKNIRDRLAKRRHLKNLRRKKNKYYQSKSNNKTHDLFQNIADIKEGFLSETLLHLKNSKKTKLLEPSYLSSEKVSNVKKFLVPEIFSLVDEPNKTYRFIYDVVNSIYHDKVTRLKLDYRKAKIVHIGAQLFLDILLKEIFLYSKNLSDKQPHLSRLLNVESINVRDKNILKLLHSIGSFAIHRKESKEFSDIVPYPLCEFKNSKTGNILFNIEKKEKDVTDMVDYVRSSLIRMDKQLSSDSLEDLSIIIGEILINAEEHSTFNHRYSIGYFQEFGNDDDKFGIFNLAILNFGGTIYDKFKDPNCKRPEIVLQMQDLSKKYTTKNLFSTNIKEETLWTLYALQDEITSVSKEKNVKRGNGSIKFIESFFKLKGSREADNISRLALLSGNTSIVFDGTYGIGTKMKGDEKYSVMTFNSTGEISDKPNSKYVKFVPNHFPGTIITAQILINKDDIKL